MHARLGYTLAFHAAYGSAFIAVQLSWVFIDVSGRLGTWRVAFGTLVLLSLTALVLAGALLESTWLGRLLRSQLDLQWTHAPRWSGYIRRHLPVLLTLGAAMVFLSWRFTTMIARVGWLNGYSIVHFEDIVLTHGPGVWRTGATYVCMVDVLLPVWLGWVGLDFAVLFGSAVTSSTCRSLTDVIGGVRLRRSGGTPARPRAWPVI